MHTCGVSVHQKCTRTTNNLEIVTIVVTTVSDLILRVPSSSAKSLGKAKTTARQAESSDRHERAFRMFTSRRNRATMPVSSYALHDGDSTRRASAIITSMWSRDIDSCFNV